MVIFENSNFAIIYSSLEIHNSKAIMEDESKYILDTPNDHSVIDFFAFC